MSTGNMQNCPDRGLVALRSDRIHEGKGGAVVQRRADLDRPTNFLECDRLDLVGCGAVK